MAISWLDLINVDQIAVQQNITSKDDLLQLVAEKLSLNPKLGGNSKDEILKALKSREAQGSTGLGGGIAAPHSSLKKAKAFSVCFITLAQPLDFGSFDKQPCSLFIGIIGPEAERNQHVQILSALASGLANLEATQALISAKSKEEAIAQLEKILGTSFSEEGIKPREPREPQDSQTPSEQPSGLSSGNSGYCRVTLVIQKERLFIPLLEELVSVSDHGSVMIWDSQNPGTFLQRMPLYSFIFNDQKVNHFQKVLETVLPTAAADNLEQGIRRIAKKIEKEAGVLYFRQSLDIVLGSLDY